MISVSGLAEQEDGGTIDSSRSGGGLLMGGVRCVR